MRGRPYIGLEPFQESDAALFFGLECDIEIVVANLYASSLTVLYGTSGAGKSSLLRAGVASRLRTEPDTAVVVFADWGKTDFDARRRAAAGPRLQRPPATRSICLPIFRWTICWSRRAKRSADRFCFCSTSSRITCFIRRHPPAGSRANSPVPSIATMWMPAYSSRCARTGCSRSNHSASAFRTCWETWYRSVIWIATAPSRPYEGRWQLTTGMRTIRALRIEAGTGGKYCGRRTPGRFRWPAPRPGRTAPPAVLRPPYFS